MLTRSTSELGGARGAMHWHIWQCIGTFAVEAQNEIFFICYCHPVCTTPTQSVTAVWAHLACAFPSLDSSSRRVATKRMVSSTWLALLPFFRNSFWQVVRLFIHFAKSIARWSQPQVRPISLVPIGFIIDLHYIQLLPLRIINQLSDIVELDEHRNKLFAATSDARLTKNKVILMSFG